jgi:alpha,alpha-trehalase
MQVAFQELQRLRVESQPNAATTDRPTERTHATPRTPRSQPPLLSAMVRAVYEATADRSLLSEALPLLVQEHDYWTFGDKAVQVAAADGSGGGGAHELSRYWADWWEPRPESYREDLETAAAAAVAAGSAAAVAGGPSAAERQCRLWHELATAAESGWDFSSRWFEDGATLATIRTSQVRRVTAGRWRRSDLRQGKA